MATQETCTIRTCITKPPSIFMHITLLFSSLIICLFLFGLGSAGNVSPRAELYVPNYKYYHNVSSIGTFITDLVVKHPTYFRLDLNFKSRSNIPQYVLHMTNFSSSRISYGSHGVSNVKPRLLLSFGEHAREFFPVESMIHLLKRITRGLYAPLNSPEDQYTKHVLSQLDIYIIVMANPDGRHLIEKTGNYCWRGTSTGVDLDRNFPWNFGGRGSSGDPGDEEFRGPFPHSEPEGRVYLELSNTHHFDAFISFHSGIKQIYIPFADSASRKAKIVPVNSIVQLALAEAMSKAGGSSFKYGIGYNLCEYPADGTIYDYMAGVKKIPYSLNVEMWGEGDVDNKQCFDLFNPPNEKLVASLDDSMPLYDALFTHLVHWKQKQIHEQYHQLGQTDLYIPKSYVIPFLLCLCVFLAIFCRQVPCAFNHRFYSRKRVVSLRSLSSTFTVSGIKIT
ncbi:carboxypeptidase A1 isoform X1 [Strongylocentrotus purpuratus]|uniref:Peptidase M14 domain-containing protein n=1 Tax=Strongylocentrotus purpuratus TaxID=7668 RepID=A0A7M7PVS0_STRPU|nr:carboxypeptidase A1 isoform X1 [Strongylocentrotus purpuratus]